MKSYILDTLYIIYKHDRVEFQGLSNYAVNISVSANNWYNSVLRQNQNWKNWEILKVLISGPCSRIGLSWTTLSSNLDQSHIESECFPDSITFETVMLCQT